MAYQLPANVRLGIVDQTSVERMTPAAWEMLYAAAAAAAQQGITLTITAGQGGGHLSHSEGTEFDLVGFNPDGSRWSPEQRVAVAQGAAQGGGDRFGLYSGGRGGQSLHIGLSGEGRPSAVWGFGGRTSGAGSRAFTNPAERSFLTAFNSGALRSGQPMAYAPETPLQGAQAAAANLAGNTGADAVSQPMNFPILDRIKARLGDRETPFLDKLRERLTEFRQSRMDRWGVQPQAVQPTQAPAPQPTTASQLTPGGAWEAGTVPRYPTATPPRQPPASPAGPNAGYLAAMVANALQAPQAPPAPTAPMMPQGFQPNQPPVPQFPDPGLGPLMPPQGGRGWGVYPPFGPQGAQGKTMGPSPISLMHILGLTQPQTGRLV